MKIWSTVSGHLAESSGARFPEEVSRLAVVSLSDCVRALLRDETPGFCFNQGLFGVFQNMLCSDSCGAETQEHIVTILCSFIQERPNQIGSGWKMLFGSIKAIRIGNIKGILR
uniref:Mon2/Sec7/BIG1-like HDS domain-containing protein n=1 Tax=Panagrolaimus davidi TaxID=227884 RepID=A0A914P744_9BILA